MRTGSMKTRLQAWQALTEVVTPSHLLSVLALKQNVFGALTRGPQSARGARVKLRGEECLHMICGKRTRIGTSWPRSMQRPME
jgi:hypothetical protein